jgi:Flp pilus assembly protein TadB
MEDSLRTKLIAVCSCVLFLVVGFIFLWYSSNIRMFFVLVIFAFLALALALRIGRQQHNR